MNQILLLDTFTKLIKDDTNELQKICDIFTSNICKIFQFKWCTLFILQKENNNSGKTLLSVSNNNIKKHFNICKKVFSKTLLYEAFQDNIKIKYVKEKFNYPEFVSNHELLIKKIDTKNSDILVEFCINIKQKFDKDDLFKTLDFFSVFVDKKIENEDKNRKISELGNLIEVSKILNSTLNLNTLLSRLFSEVKSIMNSEGCSLMLKSRNTNELEFKTVKGKKSNIIKEFKVPAGKGIAGWILRNRKAIVVNDVSKDKRFYSGMDRKSGFKTRNIIGAPLLVKDEAIGIIESVNKLNKGNFDDSDRQILVSLANLAAIAIQNAQFYQELQDLFLSTVKSLSAAIDAKDPYTKGHSERVTKYSITMAKALKKDPQFIKEIEWSASLHDIGKIGIGELILTKPGKLTDDEYKVIMGHPAIGESIMSPIKELKEILPGIRNHHERWDGKGYPDGLGKEEIPLLARIIALSDTYDAMTSSRPYRKKQPSKIALEEIANCSGTQFDPYLAKIFIKLIKKNNHKL